MFERLDTKSCVGFLLPCNKLPPNTVAWTTSQPLISSGFCWAVPAWPWWSLLGCVSRLCWFIPLAPFTQLAVGWTWTMAKLGHVPLIIHQASLGTLTWKRQGPNGSYRASPMCKHFSTGCVCRLHWCSTRTSKSNIPAQPIVRRGRPDL